MTLTLEQLLTIMPRLAKQRERAEAMLPHLNAAMQEAEINTPLRGAAFLAQLGHESLDLTRWVEMEHYIPITSCRLCQRLEGGGDQGQMVRPFSGHKAGAQYEGRKDLGNTQPGDGVRYKGRGCLQLTGRANYRAAGKVLGEPLEARPALAEELDVGFRVAAWFWTNKGLSAMADKSDFDAVTQRINGGQNGREDRRKRYAQALEILQK